MREVFLALAMLGMFAFSFFVVARIGGFLETNYRNADLRNEDRSVPVMFAPGTNAAETAEQIRKLGDAYGQCAVIVCGAEAPDLYDYIDPENVEFRYQIG